MIGIFIGGIDFSAISFGIGDAQFMVGNFVNAVIKFLIIAFVVFMLVRTVNKLVNLKTKEPEPAPEEPTSPTSEQLLAEILDTLRSK